MAIIGGAIWPNEARASLRGGSFEDRGERELGIAEPLRVYEVSWR
jgi:hypothetical protein